MKWIFAWASVILIAIGVILFLSTLTNSVCGSNLELSKSIFFSWMCF